MKAVDVETTIELNGRQIVQSVSSLNKIRKKVCQAELLLNDEPPKDEIYAHKNWHNKLHELIEVHEKLEFPTLHDVRMELEQKKQESIAIERKKLVKKENLPQRTLEKLRESREHKQYGPCKGFGPKAEGELIREIKNYNGSNCIYVKTRQLRRKDPKGSALASTGSLPPWIGPYYYENNDPKYLQQPLPNFKSIFMTAGRTPSPNRSKSRHLQELRVEATRNRILRSPPAVSPNHCRPISCEKPHSRQDFSEEAERNCFSRQSAKSTMMMIPPLSTPKADVHHHEHSPAKVLLGENSMVRTPHKLSRNFTEPEKHPKFDPYVSSDSLQAKLTHIGKKTYKVKDYTMGGLSLQVTKRPLFEETYVMEYDDDSFSTAMMPTSRKNTPAVTTSAAQNVNLSARSSTLANLSNPTGLFSRASTFVTGNSFAGVPSSNASIGAASDLMSQLSNENNSDGEGDETEELMNERKDSDDLSREASFVSEDAFRVKDLDKTLSELADVYGLSNSDEAIAPFSENVPKRHNEDENAVRFVDYTNSYRERQSKKAQRATMITPSFPPVSSDIRPHFRNWEKDHMIYSPKKPQTIKYLTEHKSAPPVMISGILFETTQHTSKEVEAMIKELDIPASYFSLPLDHEPVDLSATSFSEASLTTNSGPAASRKLQHLNNVPSLSSKSMSSFSSRK